MSTDLSLAEQIEESIEKGIKDVIKEMNKNEETTFILQEVQYNLKCCGWKNADDYSGELLNSCCGTKPNINEKTKTCPKNQIKFHEGCKEKLNFSDVTRYLGSVMGVCIAVILTELVLVFAACCLAREVRN